MWIFKKELSENKPVPSYIIGLYKNLTDNIINNGGSFIVMTSEFRGKDLFEAAFYVWKKAGIVPIKIYACSSIIEEVKYKSMYEMGIYDMVNEWISVKKSIPFQVIVCPANLDLFEDGNWEKKALISPILEFNCYPDSVKKMTEEEIALLLNETL